MCNAEQRESGTEEDAEATAWRERVRASPLVAAASAVVEIALSRLLSLLLSLPPSLREHNRGGGGCGCGGVVRSAARRCSRQVVDVGAVRSRPLLRRERRREFVARPPPTEVGDAGGGRKEERVNIWLLVAKTRASRAEWNRARRRYTKARTHAMMKMEREIVPMGETN